MVGHAAVITPRCSVELVSDRFRGPFGSGLAPLTEPLPSGAAMRLTPSGLAVPGPSRRSLLRGVGGAALLAGAGIPLLSACGGSGTSSDPKTVSLGSNASDAVPKKAFESVYATFKKQSGITVD